MNFLAPTYSGWGVAASVFIAMLASYVALHLAKRVRTEERGRAAAWWFGGSLAMGTGIWAMHFVGMLSYSLPIELGYTRVATFISWIAAVGVSGVALWVASHGRLNAARLTAGSVAMMLGICGMHYIGMSAIVIVPGIIWDMRLVAASALIALVASGVALLLFSRIPGSGHRGAQPAAAVVMGLAISGMHYTGMAAANVPAGAICTSGGELVSRGLGTLIGLSSVGILVVTLLLSMHSKAAALAKALQASNDELKNAYDELNRLAFRDPLTGLSNRVPFEARLEQAVARSKRAEARSSARNRHKIAVLFVDLDGFKPVNDSFGHAAGDLVLAETAKRLGSAARDSDTVARVGGDEFLMLIEEVQSAADAVTVAQRLVELLRAPYLIPCGREVSISASVGIVIYPDTAAVDKLVIHADAAMYAAKRAGGDRFVLYESRMDGAALRQLELQSELRLALERNELSLHYQPKVDGKTSKIHGVEALLRWQHPRLGSIAPDVFIPLAERSGLIVPLGNWVIDEACRQMKEWAGVGFRMRVAINVSVHQLRHGDFVRCILAALDRNAIDASQLLCEITESVAMEDIRTMKDTFDELAKVGIFLSIDDFGTGYSSLRYLRQLPARQVKIDRSFVSDLEQSNDARAVVRAVISLSHALGLQVVAEGVETEGQKNILIAMECDELQGFHFAKPMEPSKLLAWATGRARRSGADFSTSVIDGTMPA